MTSIRKGLAGIAICLLCAAGQAASVSPALLYSWETKWEEIVEQAVDGYLEHASSNFLAHLEEEQRAGALKELEELIYPAVAWYTLGDRVIENMVAECGEDVLAEVAPLFTGKASRNDVDSYAVSRYQSCAGTAMQKTLMLFQQAIDGLGPEIAEVHAKYGY